MADGQDWRSQSFRNQLVAQIDDAIRQAGPHISKTSQEMETHVHNKAKSKEEYLALVARLILHIKDSNKDKQQPRQQQQMMMGQPAGRQMGQMNPQMAGRPIQDPINALTNLTRPMQQQQQGMPHMMQHRPMQMSAAQIRFQQQQMQQQKPQLQRQDAFIVTSPQTNPVQSQPLPASAANLPFQSQPQTMQRQVPQMPQHMSQVPSPAQICSPAVFTAPSPQSMVAPSPVNRGAVGVLSPGAALNTPGNPGSVGAAPSPSNQRINDEQIYMEKLQQLSKYVGPLSKMVDRLEKDESQKLEHLKMKNLLDILTDPTKRVTYATLEKCEIVLEKMGKHVTQSQPQTSSSVFESLYESIASNIQSPSINHSLQRTFGPAISAFFGPAIKAPVEPCKKRRKLEEDKKEGLSNVLQGEIARLHSRFHISVDSLQHSSNTSVHLICKLDDKNLPSVPPLIVKIPKTYPQGTPECDTESEGYNSTPFFQNIQKHLEQSLLNMSNKYSLSSLLYSWEMSVRRSCED
ncbi:hypothetical protein LOTGIDRAFT_238290 [Lottia gigantea]|uniref:Mediator of RNA polymerase II transcription subunit 15 n=1 Tax=Lottia gigantea TaxID=225164 RepID=V4ABZ0_LOTGI|nr:hypothetical protein LOTGIDRAFT_238290 [Lottia gigantea]ESP01504.1 hypothetical protein LOTGIDRAFT_238290 [Lottia gigantea]